MILKSIICHFKGHDINPEESIVTSMNDKRNWLCKCHRCGLYEMHDGAISNSSVTLTRREAIKTKRYLEAKMAEINRIADKFRR